MVSTNVMNSENGSDSQRSIFKGRLLALADLLETPEVAARFDYETWAGTEERPFQGKPDLSCGTSACALGWAMTMPFSLESGFCLINRETYKRLRCEEEARRYIPADNNYDNYDVGAILAPFNTSTGRPEPKILDFEEVAEGLFGLNGAESYDLFMPWHIEADGAKKVYGVDLDELSTPTEVAAGIRAVANQKYADVEPTPVSDWGPAYRWAVEHPEASRGPGKASEEDSV